MCVCVDTGNANGGLARLGATIAAQRAARLPRAWSATGIQRGAKRSNMLKNIKINNTKQNRNNNGNKTCIKQNNRNIMADSSHDRQSKD